MVTAEAILETLSISDKAKLLSQIVWETTDIHKCHNGLNKFLLADGPAGIRRLKEYFDLDIYNTRPSTSYPSPSTYASSWSRELLYRLGEHMGREAKQEQVDTMLAPAVNLKRSPLGGRNFEYYSEDPYLTGELATEYIKGVQKEGVGACLKHFAANNQETRRMNVDARIDEATLHEMYLAAFEKPVREGRPKMVMAAYNQINGEYCASNQILLNVLRKDWGYEGVVVTDCYAAHELGKGICRGLTLQMPGECEDRIISRVMELLNTGEITEEQLDEAVLHNIEFALEAGKNRITDYKYNREAHHVFARELARESMVLLKNQGETLPLRKEERVLIVGELAVCPRFQGGGSSHVNPWRLEIPLEEIRRCSNYVEYLQGYGFEASDKENRRLAQEVSNAAGDFQKILFFAGIPELVESEGYDRVNIKIPEEQNRLISTLAERGHTVIVVLFNGSVVEMPWKDKVSAILECYLPGEAGASAAAEILFGEVNPSGKLAETFPIRLEDNPSYLYFPGNEECVIYGEGQFVGYKHYDALQKEVAFPFGHGLSYTEFIYEQAEEKTQTEHIQNTIVDVAQRTVCVKIKNKGNRAGKETVQVYVRRKSFSESPIPKKLVGFFKVLLHPGEEKKITISLDEKTFMSYSVKNHKWEKRNGVYEFFVGSSVADIRLTETVTISDIPYIITEDSSIGDMIRIPGMYKKLEEAFQNHPISLNFLTMTKDDDPLKAISMGSLTTLRTLKRVDNTLLDRDITEILLEMNNKSLTISKVTEEN